MSGCKKVFDVVQRVPWRQNVHHDVNKCNMSHDVKQFVI